MKKIDYPYLMIFILAIFIAFTIGAGVVSIINKFLVGGVIAILFCIAVICGLIYLRNHLFVIKDGISSTGTAKDNWLKLTDECKNFVEVEDKTIKVIMFKK